MAAPTGPTLQFDYDDAKPLDNPLSYFMYFVPLVSPEQVSLSTNAGNTQCAEVVSQAIAAHNKRRGLSRCLRIQSSSAMAWQRNAFGHDGHHSSAAKRSYEIVGQSRFAHQLAAISVEGGGMGTMEIAGTLTNGQPAVTEMRIRFNSRGHASPVSIDLQDIVLRDGTLHYENETVARVNTLTFRQKSDPPKMEVALASVKRKDAGDGTWANFVGGIKGAAANLLLPPLTVTTNGNQAMLDFGLALAQGKQTFTFPFAARLTNGPAIGM